MAKPPSPLASLRRLFARSSRPMYALDESQAIVFANEALADWAGVPLNELLGLRCFPLPGVTTRDALAAGLAPSPDVLLGARARLVVQAPAEQGDMRWKRRRATAISWSEGQELAAVFVMLDAEDCGDGGDGEGAPGSEAERLDDAVRHAAVRARAALVHQDSIHLLGQSALMRRVRQQVETAAASSSSVLVCGPPGAGREEVAHAVCYHESRRAGILPLACPLLDAELLTSALEDLERSRYELVEGPDAILLLDVERLPSESQGPVYQRLLELKPRAQDPCHLHTATCGDGLSSRLWRFPQRDGDSIARVGRPARRCARVGSMPAA